MNKLTNIRMLGLSESDSDNNEVAIITQIGRPRHSSIPLNLPTINTEHSSLIHSPTIFYIGMEIMIDEKLWN